MTLSFALFRQFWKPTRCQSCVELTANHFPLFLVMIHVDAMLDSLTRSMSRTGFMSPFNASKTSTTTLVAAAANAPTVAVPTTVVNPPTETRVPDPIPANVHSSTGSSLSRSSLGSHGKSFVTQVRYYTLINFNYFSGEISLHYFIEEISLHIFS